MNPRKVVVTVHGIRTFGQWQDRLKALIQAANPTVLVENYGYGYFSVIAFVIPIFRWLAVRSFRNRLRALTKAHPGASFSFVAHSFGTHLVAHALRGMKPDERPDIEVLILSGSVLKSTFDWTRMMGSDPPGKGEIRRVVNDCGLNDSVLILSQAAVLFTGMAGRVGFYGFTGSDLLNRFFPGGHSHYFMPPSSDRDAFMRRYWVPLLADGAPPEAGGEIPAANALKGVEYALFRIADPVKMAMYGLLGFILVNYAYLEPRAAARLEQGRQEYGAAATQMASDRTVPDAFSSIASIVDRGLLPQGGDYRHALMLARFALQRLTPAAEAIERVPPGRIFSWSDFNYLKANSPVRVAVDTPIAFVRDDGLNRLIVVDRNSTVTIMDTTDGHILAQLQPDDEGEVSSEVVVQRLKATPTQYIVSFKTKFANDEDSTSQKLRIELAGHVEMINTRDSAADVDALPVLSPDCAWVLQTQDDDEAASDGTSPENAADCVEAIPSQSISSLPFPLARAEAHLWTAQAPSTPAAASEPDCLFADRAAFPAGIRSDPDKIDFSQLTDRDGAPPSESVVNAFINWDLDACFFDFEGPDERHFLAKLAVTGQWNYSWIVCAMNDAVSVSRCVSMELNWDASGRLWLSPDKRFLAIADRGLFYRPAWGMIDLATMTPRFPDRSSSNRTIAMTFVGTDLIVVSPARAASGGVEVWAYRTDQAAMLRARRVFPFPDGFSVGEEQANDTTAKTVLFESDGNVVLATAFGQVAALTLESYSFLPRWVERLVERVTGPRPSSDAIATPWSIAETGLDPKGPVTIAISPNRDVLAIAGGSSLRLIQAADGRFLTSAMDVSGLPGCSGPIESIVVRDDLSVSAKTADCVANRAAPPSVGDTEAALADPSNYLGGGTPLRKQLPGEVAAKP